MIDEKEEVKEALAPEEKPIIENIISLFQQLLSMQEGQAANEIVTEAIDEEEDEVEKSSDGETGDDPAEKRIEEVTPLTDASLQDLKKSIAILTSRLNGGKIVKSVVKKNQNTEVLKQISNVLKSIVEKQNNQESLNAKLFDALGFTDEIVKKTLPENNVVKKDRPIQNIDTVQVVKDVLTEVFKAMPQTNTNPSYQHPFNQKKEARKDLQGIAEYIHKGNKG